MSAEIWGQIITAIVTIAGLYFTYLKTRDAAIAAKGALVKGEENYTAIQILDVKTDGRLTQLLEERRLRSIAEAGQAHAEGVIAGGLARTAELAAAAPDPVAAAAATRLLERAAEAARAVIATAASETCRGADCPHNEPPPPPPHESAGPDDILARTLRYAGTGPPPEPK